MLRVTNLERSIKWYENVLGCKLVKERDNPDYKYKLAFMGGGSSLCRQSYNCLTRRRRSLHEPDLHLQQGLLAFHL